MKQFCRVKELINNQKGIALVTVLLVIVVVSIMGVTLLAITTNNVKMSSVERSYQSSYYIAESGINYRMNDISTKLKNDYSQAANLTDFFSRVETDLQIGQTVTYNNFESSFGQQPSAQIRIDKVPSDMIISYSNDYKITSTGTINNRSRTVSKIIHVTWKPKASVTTIPASTVMFFYNSITLHNVLVTGKIATNQSSVNNSDLTGTNTSNTNITFNTNTQKGLPVFPSFSISSHPDVLPAPDQTKTIYLKMTRDMSFTNINVDAGYTLIIDVGSSNRNIAVTNLTCNGTIKFADTATGKLTLYTKSLNMGTSGIINPNGNIEKLYIFNQGVQSNIDNGVIYGSMYVTNIPIININYYLPNNSNKKSSGVQGHLITDATSITFKGDPCPNAKMIYAPYASVSLNESMQGSFIASSITANGNNTSYQFTFVQINYDNSPLFVDTGSGQSPVQDMITSEPTREID